VSDFLFVFSWGYLWGFLTYWEFGSVFGLVFWSDWESDCVFSSDWESDCEFGSVFWSDWESDCEFGSVSEFGCL
jgi:hypothetical protein